MVCSSRSARKGQGNSTIDGKRTRISPRVLSGRSKFFRLVRSTSPRGRARREPRLEAGHGGAQVGFVSVPEFHDQRMPLERLLTMTRWTPLPRP